MAKAEKKVYKTEKIVLELDIDEARIIKMILGEVSDFGLGGHTCQVYQELHKIIPEQLELRSLSNVSRAIRFYKGAKLP